MSFFEKIFATIIGVVIVGSFILLGIMSLVGDPSQPRVAKNHAEAIAECGGPAVLDSKLEDAGDGQFVEVIFFRCANGDRVLAYR